MRAKQSVSVLGRALAVASPAAVGAGQAPAPVPLEPPAVWRLWRLRKLHQHVDAELHDDGDGVQVQFFFNGELAYGRRWPTRALALSEAAAKHAELEREGWMAHW